MSVDRSYSQLQHIIQFKVQTLNTVNMREKFSYFFMRVTQMRGDK